MITLAWFKRRKAQGEEIFELEEFLRSVTLIYGEAKASAQTAPAQQAEAIDPPRPAPTVRPRQASGEPGDRPQPARPAVPSEPPRRELDERLDEALLETFPASDPIAVSAAS